MSTIDSISARILGHPCCHRVVDESGAATEDSDSGEDFDDQDDDIDEPGKEGSAKPSAKKSAPPPPPPPPPKPAQPIRRSTIPPPEAEAVKYCGAMRKLLEGMANDNSIRKFLGLHDGFYLEPADPCHALMFYKKRQLVPETPLDYVNAVPHFYFPSDCPSLLPLATAVHSSLFLCAWIASASSTSATAPRRPSGSTNGPTSVPKTSAGDATANQKLDQQLFTLVRQPGRPEWKLHPVKLSSSTSGCTLPEYLGHLNKILETKGAQWTLDDVVPIDRVSVVRRGSDFGK